MPSSPSNEPQQLVHNLSQREVHWLVRGVSNTIKTHDMYIIAQYGVWSFTTHFKLARTRHTKADDKCLHIQVTRTVWFDSVTMKNLGARFYKSKTEIYI